MKKILCALGCVGTMVAVLLGAMGTASASSSDIALCKNGGYVNFIDQATGKPFVNQGRCVSVVARGGVLVPVVPPASVGAWTIGPDGIGHCRASATLTGAPSTSYPLTWLADGAVGGVEDATTGVSGTAAIGHTFPKGAVAQLVVDEQTFNLPTIGCTVPLIVTSWTMNPPGDQLAGSCDVQVAVTGDVSTTYPVQWSTVQGTPPNHIPPASVTTAADGSGVTEVDGLQEGDTLQLTVNGHTSSSPVINCFAVKVGFGTRDASECSSPSMSIVLAPPGTSYEFALRNETTGQSFFENVRGTTNAQGVVGFQTAGVVPIGTVISGQVDNGPRILATCSNQ